MSAKEWFDIIIGDCPLAFKEGRCKYAACGPGWEALLARAFRAIEAHLAATPELTFRLNDIKEKYGTLRLYYDGGNDTIAAIVEEAEFWSGRTCDRCGKPGLLNGQGWLQTTCPEHKPDGVPWSRKLSDWTHSGDDVEESKDS